MEQINNYYFCNIDFVGTLWKKIDMILICILLLVLTHVVGQRAPGMQLTCSGPCRGGSRSRLWDTRAPDTLCRTIHPWTRSYTFSPYTEPTDCQTEPLLGGKGAEKWASDVWTCSTVVVLYMVISYCVSVDGFDFCDGVFVNASSINKSNKCKIYVESKHHHYFCVLL